MKTLYPYQKLSLEALEKWFVDHQTGNPVLVIPTGGGKSLIIAEFCKDALQNWPETRVLMLTHQQELIQQNAEELLDQWPNAPLGIYSAGLRKRVIDEPITFAGIGSVYKRAQEIGHVDIIKIDECFIAGTKVSTPDGDVSIEKLKCGDAVYNQIGVGFIEAVSCNLTSNLYKVELSNGTIIKCTGNHEFFTGSGWKPAKELASGEDLYRVEDMSSLWESVQTLDKKRKRDTKIGTARAIVEKAELLLDKVCEEINPDMFECKCKKENIQQAKGDKTQAYKTWGERAVTTFASSSVTPRVRGWLGIGVGYKNSCRFSQWGLSELLQGRYRKRKIKDSNRIGWRKSRSVKSQGKRHKKNSTIGKIRVVSVSRVESKSLTPVFNLQVSGHPSYFANGVAVHNCHLINNEQNGRYRHLIKELKIINPYLRVIGYSATPYRLGQGMLTEGTNALFSDIIEPVTVSHLIAAGYLCELRSKSTSTKLDVSGVHKRGGEFIESELQAAVNDELTNVGVVNEILRRGEGRKAGIVFASGILHAQELNRLLLEHGEKSAIVTGTTPKKERTQIFTDFKSGELRFLVNVKVATTGFNHKGIDLIADVQPTLSPGLYVQKAGRGLRIHPDKTDCLVLDFAGNINTHGPITNITPPKPKGVQEGEAPVKVCPECDEVIHISVMVCPSCGYEFPIAEATFKLSNADIMGRDNSLEMEVSQWHWSVHTSSTSGKELLKVQYYGKNLSDPVVAEFLCIGYEGYPGKKAWRVLTEMAVASGADTGATGLSEIVGVMQAAPQPTMIKYQKDGKYYRVTDRSWEPVQSELALTT